MRIQLPPTLKVPLLLALVAAWPGVASAQYEPAGCLNPEEAELAMLVDDYRAQNALPAVPVSNVLTEVAQWHTADHAYAIEVTGEWGSDPSCNLHTWYGTPTGTYSTCCYTSDHAQASCMWNKPTEVSSGTYISTGYENAAKGYASVAAALDGWKNSPGHNDVILNQGIWSSLTWQAMGVGVDPTNATYFLWFATAADGAATPVACTGTPVPAIPPAGLAVLALVLAAFGVTAGRTCRLRP